MDAIEALSTRVSCPKLEEPAPTSAQIDQLMSAAVRAADHGCLKPWRFMLIQGEGLPQLGQVFLKAALEDEPELSEAQQQKTLNMPLRAPAILVAIASCQEHPKVPLIEQQIAAGAATQNIITAAYALGLGAMWRTGAMAYSEVVCEALGLSDHEMIIGFVYLGTPQNGFRTLQPQAPNEFISDWPSQG